MPTLFENIMQAHQALRPQVRVTPLDHSVLLSSRTGCEVYLKCEHLQPSESCRLGFAYRDVGERTEEPGWRLPFVPLRPK